MTETETAEIDEIAYLAADVVVQTNKTTRWYVLLIERRWEPHLGLWALPGGHLKRGEDVAAGGRRELLEETGLQWCWALAGCVTCAGSGEHVVNDHEYRDDQRDPDEGPQLLYPQRCECLWPPPSPITRALDQLPDAHRPGAEESIQR